MRSLSNDLGRRVSAPNPAQAAQAAQADYDRFRAAYLDVARNEPGNEVALAMIGADMDRAHARLQEAIGLPTRNYANEPSAVLRREAERFSEENA